MAQEFSRRPLTTDVQVRARIHVGFLVDKVAMVQDFLRVFLAHRVIVILLFLYTHICHSSEMLSHPIDMNKKSFILMLSCHLHLVYQLTTFLQVFW
jgi:hypothetical protein